MHDWFAPSVSSARAEVAVARAARHRARVAAGSDLRSRMTRPLIHTADRAVTRLETRRDAAAATFGRPDPCRATFATPRHA